MHYWGLKLWSVNKNYIEEALRLYNKDIYDYIELYVVPGTYQSNIDWWVDLPVPYVIHAPHFGNGLNLAKKEKFGNNLLLIKEAQQFADRLKANKIIVHPGIGGNIEETAHQLQQINEERILIENKPYYAIFDDLICNGNLVEEIKYILDNVKVGFCLDVGHAFNSANAHKIEPMVYLKEFMKLKPEMCHLTDGDYNGIYDNHAHFGDGNYDIRNILKILPQVFSITVETDKDSENSLSDFETDISFLKICWESIGNETD